MKIAAITDDGKSISQHFGRAPYYMVVTVESGKIVNHEMLNKLGHSRFGGDSHEHQEEANGRHGYGPEAEDRHARMAEAIIDCEALLCRGMGMGAFESMRSRNIFPVVTDIANIDEAVMAYVNGKIVNHTEMLH